MMNRVMLRFRPIAPKPAGGESVPGDISTKNNSKVVLNGRAKRKYAKVRKNEQCKRKKTSAAEDQKESKDGLEKRVLTLQMLPDRSDGNMNSQARETQCNLDQTRMIKAAQGPPIWLNSKNPMKFNMAEISGSDRAVVELPRRLVESWVTVECVTETCMDGGELGFSDIERIKNLAVDTCPGFVSDGLNRVQWVNEAYNKMVRRGDERQSWAEELRVCLGMKESLPYLYPAFTCRVRLEYTWRKHKCSSTVPCDVWRMDFGGFAWKLDVKAALTLGRSTDMEA